MSVDIRCISIAIREAGGSGVWRMVVGEPVPVSVLMCDIRRGRSAELRLEVAKAVRRDRIEILGLRENHSVRSSPSIPATKCITRRWGGYSPEWSEGEA
jgi:hypothetical protein